MTKPTARDHRSALATAARIATLGWAWLLPACDDDKPAEADTPCSGDCFLDTVTADSMGVGPYPDPDAAPPDALPQPAPPVWPPPRVQNQTCRMPEVPPLATMEVDVAFPALAFERPVAFTFAPGDGARRYVVEQGGTIWVFEGRQDVSGLARFLTIDVSRVNSEEGLLGLAFHPRYAENGKLYVYHSLPAPEPSDRHTVIAEYTRGGDGNADPTTRRVLLDVPQPYGNHKGGSLLFGPDGYLYLGLGDGGSGGDPQNRAQNRDELLGKVLRIDVDTGDEHCLTPYGVPEDNPFAEGRCAGGEPAGRPEIFALGVRNPWRMSFDRDTGKLWAGDVGQDEWEEISVIERGGNYGWREVEGEVCYRGDCTLQDFLPPVYVYPHSVGKSITGGYVYRGRALPELWGAYVYADYLNGNVWALRVDERGRVENTLLVESKARVASLGEDPEGELYLVTFTGGRNLLTLKRGAEVEAPPSLPQRLSQTGCFADTASETLAESVVPYELNAPLWSDGTTKRRAFALPAEQRATFGDTPEAHVEFPLGTVLVKTFAAPAFEATPERRIETRLLVRQPRGWQGFSYRWREDGSDADLLAGADTVTVPTADGPLEWKFPSRAQCNDCHTEAGGGSLGPSHAQWNRPANLGGNDRPQIAELVAAGYLESPPGAPPAAFPRPDDATQTAEARARALLHANCSFCHQPDGPGNASIDLRASTPLAQMGLCNVEPGQGDLGVAGAKLLVPGSPETSVMVLRMRARGEGQMPPLATNRPDEVAVRLLTEWISGLAACP